MSEIRNSITDDIVEKIIVRHDFSNFRKIFEQIKNIIKTKDIIIRPIQYGLDEKPWDTLTEQEKTEEIKRTIERNEKGMRDYFPISKFHKGRLSRLTDTIIEEIANEFVNEIIETMEKNKSKEIQFICVDILYAPYACKLFANEFIAINTVVGCFETRISDEQIYLECKFNLFDKDGKKIECYR